jgi:2-amino-4-hydroxy-6-hydroxymethyldihydropteridine diphosphokinase
VVIVATGLSPSALLAGVNGIEADFGRVRAERFGPRTLDIDIISFAEEVSGDPVLTLPHPRAHERAFVLAPWHDLDPGAQLPGRGAVADLLATTLASQDVQLRAALALHLPGPDAQMRPAQ